MGLYKYVVRVRVWGIFMNDKNIFIGVCEDSLHINLVKGYIDDFFNEFHNYEVLEFVSGEDLLSNYPNNIDLLFLDIQMNGLNGMDVARRIREFDNNVEIIFTTSVLDYVCEGYEVNAYRYMLKPIEYNIFKNNMGKCIENIIKKKNDFLTINDKSKLIKIKFDDILYPKNWREIRITGYFIYWNKQKATNNTYYKWTWNNKNEY